MLRKIFAAASLVFLFLPTTGFAQTIETDPGTTNIVRAGVVSVVGEKTGSYLGGSGQEETANDQKILVRILAGKKAGTIVLVDNYSAPFSPGDTLYLDQSVNSSTGKENYSVQDVDRLPGLYALIAFFIVLVFLLGGKQGARGLASLSGSLVLVLFLLIPGILHGYSPVFLSISVSFFIIVLGAYVTHGFNKTTTAAVCGMVATVLVTGLFGYVAVHACKLTGLASEDAVNLNFNVSQHIDYSGLLFGGILIGLLGILYDIAIGQAIAVEELRALGSEAGMTREKVYDRAIRIGREHIGAVINMLVLAYVGVGLPLLLLLSSSAGIPHEPFLNQEILATEVVRAIVGSVGLILAVPVTTFIAVYLWTQPKEELASDKNMLK